MEKRLIVPKNEKVFSSLLDDVEQGFRVRLLRAGKPVAMVVPLQMDQDDDGSGQFMRDYLAFREKHDLDHLDFDFEKELRAVRYREPTSGREFEW